jgi:transposase InsO family protein
VLARHFLRRRLHRQALTGRDAQPAVVIFTFLLRRYERLYLCAFMDDHSRFIVGWALLHHQKSELVLEALTRAIAKYGVPEEILTDQGRQYTVWRGETQFEQELRRQRIRHIKSRPQRPQTLGKVERFWKTLWDEFLSRTVFADFADCERRLGPFVDGSSRPLTSSKARKTPWTASWAPATTLASSTSTRSTLGAATRFDSSAPSRAISPRTSRGSFAFASWTALPMADSRGPFSWTHSEIAFRSRTT